MDPRACDGRTTVCPLWLFGQPLLPHSHAPLQIGAAKFPYFELIRVDAVKATHVQHDHVFATRALAISVRLVAAGLAERGMNRALVELIVGHVILAGEKLEIGPCNGGQQGLVLAAARAIAAYHFTDFGLRFVANLSALAAAGVGFFHRSLHGFIGDYQSSSNVSGCEMRFCCMQYDISISRQRRFTSVPNGAVSMPPAGAAFFPSSSRR